MTKTDLIQVLLVEDNDDDAYLIAEALEEQFHVTRIQDGQQAYEHLATTQTPPDVILMDYRLPEMNGLEIIRELNKHGNALAYIVLTVDLQIETAIEAMKAGALDFLPKARGYEELPEMIEKVHQIHQDREEKKRMEAALRENERQLRELNASKDKFFSILAHDLKNPFVALLSFVDLLEECIKNGNKEQIEELTGRLQKSTENLSALLENLLTWSRIQRGMIAYQPKPSDIHKVVNWNVYLVKPKAEQKQITLRNMVQEQTFAYADYDMLDSIMRNLISNALKFTETGCAVEISATQDEDTVTIAIADTGIGIPEKELPGLFQIDAKNQRRGTAGEKGTGLGLILCKEFVEKNGGRIWVESEAGKGTTFMFTLPRIG